MMMPNQTLLIDEGFKQSLLWGMEKENYYYDARSNNERNHKSFLILNVVLKCIVNVVFHS